MPPHTHHLLRGKLKTYFYSITGFICTLLFLAVLFVMALWQYFLGRKKNATPVKRHRSHTADSLTPLNNVEFDHFVHGDVREETAVENPFGYHEDTKLVPDLAYYYKQYHLDVETFEVTTPDGFILDMWHIIDPQETDRTHRPAVMMLHGLLQSSGSFCSSGTKSLAFFMHQNGYDVWLANNRCGFTPKMSSSNTGGMWDWDMFDMANYDLKSLVDFVIQKTGKPKISLVAHSQGTTQSFIALVKTDMRKKIDTFVALAPAVFAGPLLQEKGFVRFMSNYITSDYFFGVKSFMPIMMAMRSLMVGHRIFGFLSYAMFNFLFDWSDNLWDPKLRNRHFLFSPVYISVRLMRWWLSDNESSFRSSGKVFPDNETWFTNDDDPKLLLFIPKLDRLVDGWKLVQHFVHHEDPQKYKIWYIDEYSHLDVLWADDVIERIGKPMLAEMVH